MKLNELEDFPELGNTIVIDGIEYVKKREPVAWITEWVQRYRHNDTPIMDRAVSFTKGDAPAVPNPNYIPLYTAPPTREPLSEDEVRDGLDGKNGFENWYDDRFVDGVRFAEKHHGIGVDDEN